MKTLEDLYNQIYSDISTAEGVKDTVWFDKYTTLYEQIVFSIDEWLEENGCMKCKTLDD